MVLSATLLLFGVYTSVTVPLQPTLQQGVFLLIVVLIAVLAHPAPRKLRFVDAALAIVGALPLRRGGVAWTLGLAAFIVPFMFTENMALFIGQPAVFDTVQATLTGLLGVACLAMATLGYLFGPVTIDERSAYCLASLLLLYPTLLVSLFGIAIAGALLAMHISNYRLKAKGQTPSE